MLLHILLSEKNSYKIFFYFWMQQMHQCIFTDVFPGKCTKAAQSTQKTHHGMKFKVSVLHVFLQMDFSCFP